MLFTSLSHLEKIQTLKNQLDAFELRLDLFPKIDLPLIQDLIYRSKCPIMLTLRKRPHETEKEREAWIERLLELRPPYFDLEYDMREDFLRKTIINHPVTKCILSYHDFEKVPSHLPAIYRAMRRYPAYGYKIAVTPRSTEEALRALLFARDIPHLSLICMGEFGEFARVLGPVIGNQIDYAKIDEKGTAPGQISVSDFIDTYHYRALNRTTALYGLIGDPISQSRGHLHHNQVFAERKINAVYVKMIVKPDELETFFPLAMKLGFRGLSVTMPLKEKVIPFLHSIDPEAKKMGAVNTLLIEKGRIFGTNTDGVGALDAIEKKEPVLDKKVVLLGAGGAARSIAFEARRRGARVLILNRTIQRAKELALAVGCEVGSLEDAPLDYDILINCTPEMVIAPSKINPEALVMDIVWSSKQTPLLREASHLGCQIVYGEEMFENQAAKQTALWLR